MHHIGFRDPSREAVGFGDGDALGIVVVHQQAELARVDRHPREDHGGVGRTRIRSDVCSHVVTGVEGAVRSVERPVGGGVGRRVECVVVSAGEQEREEQAGESHRGRVSLGCDSVRTRGASPLVARAGSAAHGPGELSALVERTHSVIPCADEP